MFCLHVNLQTRRKHLIIDGYKSPCGCWASNSGPLEEHAASAEHHTTHIRKLTGTAAFVSFNKTFSWAWTLLLVHWFTARLVMEVRGWSILGKSSLTKQHPQLCICQLVRGILKWNSDDSYQGMWVRSPCPDCLTRRLGRTRNIFTLVLASTEHTAKQLHKWYSLTNPWN